MHTLTRFGIAGAVAALAVPAASGAAFAVAPAPSTIYVSPTATQSNGGTSCADASETSIQTAVDSVGTGGTVVVCAGTYKEQVSIGQTLTLRGKPGAIVDATGQFYGVGIGADDVTVKGLTVENGTATDPNGPPGDGILLAALINGAPVVGNDAIVSGNRLVNNQGSGIDLLSTHGNLIANNVVKHNGGGINISNDLGGPSYDNVITGNNSSRNGFCGIIMADHTGTGIYGNRVTGNVANGNGAHGGAGILMATPTAKGSVRDNLIRGNEMRNNGHAGLEVHVHAKGANFSGNRVLANNIGTNNLAGDWKDTKTTAIYIGSVSKMTIVVANNHIHDDVRGMFVAGKVTVKRHGNTYTNVKTPFYYRPDYAG